MTGTETRFYRAGKLIKSPRNWKGIEIECNWTDRREKGLINMPTLSFVTDEATAIRNRIYDGMSGGVGIFEGDTLDIEFGNQGSPVFTFNGYLDYANDAEFIGENEVRVSMNKVQGTDWLNDVADGFSFASLHDEGIIPSSDFIKVPYIINYVPDNMQVIMLSISTFMLTKTLLEEVYGIGEAIAEIINSVTPSVGTGVTMDIGDIIWVILKIILRIAYAIFLAIAIYKLMVEILEQLFPKKRNHLGMSIKTLMLRGCQKLNITLESTLIDSISDWVVIPSKFAKGGEPPKGETEKGCPLNTDSFYTFGDLIRFLMKWFNADFRLENGFFKFEQELYWQKIATYIIPATYTDQDKLQNHQGFNTNELVANYTLAYDFDVQDQNTMENQNGRVCQVVTEPVITNNAKLKNITGLTEIRIGMSLGLEKTEFTKIEKIAISLAELTDTVINAFGGSSNLKGKVQDRLGCLLLSSHFTSMMKLVVMNGAKLRNNQRNIVDISKIYDNFHFSKSFVPVNGLHNQWLKLPEKTIPFSKNDFVTLSESNYCYLDNGQKARIDYLKWNPYAGTAIVKSSVNQLYTNNLKIRKVQ